MRPSLSLALRPRRAEIGWGVRRCERFFSVGHAVKKTNRTMAALVGALVGCVLVGLAGLSQAQMPRTWGAFSPPVFIPPPELAAQAGPDFAWMVRPEAQAGIQDRLLFMSGQNEVNLRRSPHYSRAFSALSAEWGAADFDGGQHGFIDGKLYFVENGELFVDGERDPLIDIGKLTGYTSWTLNAWESNWKGDVIAVAVANAAAEIGVVVLYDRIKRRLIGKPIGPAIGEWPFVWIDDDHIAVRAPRTTDRVRDNPNRGAGMVVYKVEGGEPIGRVFAADTKSVGFDPDSYPGLESPYHNSPLALGFINDGARNRVFVTERAKLLANAQDRLDWREFRHPREILSATALDRTIVFIAKDETGAATLYRRGWGGRGGRDVVIARGERELQYTNVFFTGAAGYVYAQSGAVTRLFQLTPDWRLKEVALPMRGTVWSGSVDPLNREEVWLHMSALGQADAGVLVRGDSVVDVDPVKAQQGSLAANGRAQVVIEFARSADGAQVPLVLLTDKAAPSGPRPVMLEVYGSYGDTSMLGGNDIANAWVQLGGVWGHCHVRGGGYYGPARHAAGRGPDKRKAHEDAIACLQHLVSTGRAPASMIALSAASAGAMVAGPVALTRPELMGAVMITAGSNNPLRMFDSFNGPQQRDEFGDARKPAVARQLASSDNVTLAQTAKAAPPMLFCVGITDPRVPIWETARFAAVLAQRLPQTEVVVLANATAGHDCTFMPDDAKDRWAMRFAWLLERLKP
jgi:prolyl oligopeptidase